MHKAAETFIERVSLSFEEYGLSRIGGRMLGFFLIDGEAHSLDELAEHLQVSKGSVSTNARLLERRGLLKRRCRPGDRRDFYTLAENPWCNMAKIAQNRMRDMSTLFEESVQELPSEMEGARRRLTAWSEFYSFVVEDIDRQLEQGPSCDADASSEV